MSIEASVDQVIAPTGTTVGLGGLNLLRSSANVLDNPHETSILQAYLTSKGLTPDTMLKECIQKIDAGTIPPVSVSVRPATLGLGLDQHQAPHHDQ